MNTQTAHEAYRIALTNTGSHNKALMAQIGAAQGTIEIEDGKLVGIRTRWDERTGFYHARRVVQW